MTRPKGQRTKTSRKPRSDRGSQGDSINHQRPPHALLVSLVALVAIIFLAPVIYPKRSEIDTANSKLIDVTDAQIVQEFMRKFVCHYKPNRSNKTDATTSYKADIPGYCHPKLHPSPKKRTQVVSSSQLLSSSDRLFSLKYTRDWWKSSLYQYYPDGIHGSEVIMTLPRPLQIWDLDALRDAFIQQHFLGFSPEPERVALHKDTSNPLDSGAYLAVYLLRLLHGVQKHPNTKDNQCQADEEECPLEVLGLIKWTDTKQCLDRIELLKDYLSILPTYDDRVPMMNSNNPHEHPIVWNRTLIEALFPRYTHTYNLIMSYQAMLQSEYDALKSASPDEFGSSVSYAQYLSMRVNVLSRAFSAMASSGDTGPSWNAINNSQALSDELKSYATENFGEHKYSLDDSDTSEKFNFRSMCPLLDMYNSHPNPNVAWRFDPATSSYVVRAQSEGINPGQEIIVSYGKYTEGHLFAKYGYVNGDGSSKTEVSLNVFHRMLGDIGLSWQFSFLSFHAWDQHHGAKSLVKSNQYTKQTLEVQSKELLRYLMFDDGDKECIHFDNNDFNSLSKHQELKWLKFQHLKRVANIGEAWIVRLPPRFPKSKLPQDGSPVNSISNRDESKVGIDAKRILSTCRLISLTTNDIGGNAISYLKDGLSNSNSKKFSTLKQSYFLVEKQDDSLEYRALMCVVRFSDMALRRYAKYAQPGGNIEPDKNSTREWTAWYIRDGEIRILSILRQTAANEASKLKANLKSSGSIFIRERPCPIESSMPMLLMEDTKIL